MPGELDLARLLKTMQPKLDDQVYVFCTVASQRLQNLNLEPLFLFQEEEGTTLVLRREVADEAGLTYFFPSKKITLAVHSDLNAVGFLAEMTARLAEAGISVNVASAFYHDHLFVPVARAQEAMDILTDLSS